MNVLACAAALPWQHWDQQCTCMIACPSALSCLSLLLIRSMSLAMAPHGVRVNAIGPGSIMTDVLAAVANDENGMRRILSRTPMMRIGDPLEVGQASLVRVTT